MKGPVPASIGNLTALTDIVLDDSLSGSIPASMGNLVNLTRLSLQINQLTGSIPASLGNLVNLKVLLLDDNKLTGSIQASLGNLTQIEDLNFSENQLSDSVPSTLDNFNPGDISALGFSINAFTFSGLEGIATAYAGTNTGMDDQANIPLHLNGNVFSVSAGGTLSNNTYTWTETSPVYKNLVTNIGDSTFTATANGTYFVTVTNSLCTPSFSLTLTSDTLRISSLPVRLLNFTSSLIKNNVLLAWETATEINSSYFNVQRSIDGINFSNIYKVAAAGNSTTGKNYSYTDANITSLNAPNVYYRLQETDKDGEMSYSNIINVKINAATGGVSVYPNPAKDALNLSINNKTGNALISVIDITGKKLQELNKTLQPGTVVNINISNLATGTYFIHISINGIVMEQKFVKE